MCGQNDSTVVVDIATIRKATVMLIERNQYKELNKQKDSLIFDYKNYIDEQNKNITYLKNVSFLLNEQNEEINRINEDLSKRLNKQKTWTAVLGGTALTGIAATLLVLLIK